MCVGRLVSVAVLSWQLLLVRVWSLQRFRYASFRPQLHHPFKSPAAVVLGFVHGPSIDEGKVGSTKGRPSMRVHVCTVVKVRKHFGPMFTVEAPLSHARPLLPQAPSSAAIMHDRVHHAYVMVQADMSCLVKREQPALLLCYQAACTAV